MGSATSRVDSSKAMMLQNKIPHRTEYTFTVHNTDAKERSVGEARNMHLHMDLPKGAQLEDAYFYLEGKKRADKVSHSCKLSNGDKSTQGHANCRGDQKALRQLTGEFVHAERHTKGTVITST